MSKIDLNKRKFITLASTLGLSAVFCPLTGLMLPESAMAAPMVPLRLRNVHTDERYDIELFNGPDLNMSALMVCDWMLRDHRQAKGKQVAKCDPKLYVLLYVMQRGFNPNGYININSGYRSPETNAMLRARSLKRTGGRATAETPAVHSQHIRAKAVDFSIPNVPPLKAAQFALKFKMGGVGSYSTFTHIDTGSVRSWGRGL